MDVLGLFMEAFHFPRARHKVIRSERFAGRPRLEGINHAFDIRKRPLHIEIEPIIWAGQFLKHPPDRSGFDRSRPLRRFLLQTADDIVDEMPSPTSCAGAGFMQLAKGAQKRNQIDGAGTGYRLCGRSIGVGCDSGGGLHRGLDETELLPDGEIILLACRGSVSDDLDERQQGERCAFDIGEVYRCGRSAEARDGTHDGLDELTVPVRRGLAFQFGERRINLDEPLLRFLSEQFDQFLLKIILVIVRVG